MPFLRPVKRHRISTHKFPVMYIVADPYKIAERNKHKKEVLKSRKKGARCRLIAKKRKSIMMAAKKLANPLSPLAVCYPAPKREIIKKYVPRVNDYSGVISAEDYDKMKAAAEFAPERGYDWAVHQKREKH